MIAKLKQINPYETILWITLGVPVSILLIGMLGTVGLILWDDYGWWSIPFGIFSALGPTLMFQYAASHSVNPEYEMWKMENHENYSPPENFDDAESFCKLWGGMIILCFGSIGGSGIILGTIRYFMQ